MEGGEREVVGGWARARLELYTSKKGGDFLGGWRAEC